MLGHYITQFGSAALRIAGCEGPGRDPFAYQPYTGFMFPKDSHNPSGTQHMAGRTLQRHFSLREVFDRHNCIPRRYV